MKILMMLFDALFPQRAQHLMLQKAILHIHPKKMRGTPITHLLSYSDPAVRACIREAKFHDSRMAQEKLGKALKEYTSSLSSPLILVPVPLSTKRRKERGYNQVEQVLKAGGLAYESLLIRTRHTVAQTSLPKEGRRKNLEKAFMCPTPLSPIPIYVAIDDVATTGATLLDAGRALREAGAKKIQLISLSH